MKKFIRTTSPISAGTTLLLDASAIGLFIAALIKLIQNYETKTLLFLGLLAFGVFVALKVTIDQLRTGVEFHEKECVFNSLDDDNTFRYDEITQVKTSKDDQISFTKNFVDRSGYISIELKSGKKAVIQLMLISSKKLACIKDEIILRMEQSKASSPQDCV